MSLLLLAGCGGGEGGDSFTSVTTQELAGTWVLTWTENGECGDDTTPMQDDLIVTAEDDREVTAIQVTANGQRNWSARLVSGGTRLLVRSNSYAHQGGVSRTDIFHLDIVSLQQIEGVLPWTWEDGAGSFMCTGTTNLVAVR